LRLAGNSWRGSGHEATPYQVNRLIHTSLVFILKSLKFLIE
jgi:hypothetical protein